MRLIAIVFLTMFLFTSCQKIDFDQGLSQNTESDEIVSPDSAEAVTPGEAEIPKVTVDIACTLFNGHVVAYSDSLSTDSVELTLVSLQEWGSLPSANNTTHPSSAADTTAVYVEGNLSDWHIPTTAEAKRLKELYEMTQEAYDSIAPAGYPDPSGFIITVTPDTSEVNLYNLNVLLQSQGGNAILLTQSKSNIRYLCEDATKSFSFVSGTVISKAGTKQSNYHLRLFKTLRVSIR